MADSGSPDRYGVEYFDYAWRALCCAPACRRPDGNGATIAASGRLDAAFARRAIAATLKHERESHGG